MFTNSKAKLSKGAKSSYADGASSMGLDIMTHHSQKTWLKEKGKNKHPKVYKV